MSLYEAPSYIIALGSVFLANALPQDSSRILLKEILSLSIKWCKGDFDDCAILKNTDLVSVDDEIYVTFRFGERDPGQSVILRKPNVWNTDEKLGGLTRQ